MRIAFVWLMFVLANSPSWAESCKIFEWSFTSPGDYLVIVGTATCPAGTLYIRGFNAATGAFVGYAVTQIRDYAFRAYIKHERPPGLAIMYAIEREGWLAR